MSAFKSLVGRHLLVSFFLLAYALTWLGAIPYSLGVFEAPLLPLGPFLAALIVASLGGGWSATKSLLLRMVQWRVARRWYALALLLPVAILVCAIYANVLYGAPAPSGDFMLQALPGIVPIFAFALLFPLSGAFGEELGWRGFALPRLLADRSPLAASLILGLLVAIWHAPLFVTGMYGDAPLRILSMVALTMVFTLLANGSGGSVLLAMLFHAGLNAWPELVIPAFSGTDLERLMRLYAIVSIAAGVVAAVVGGRRFARRTAPHTAHVVTAPVAA